MALKQITHSAQIKKTARSNSNEMLDRFEICASRHKSTIEKRQEESRIREKQGCQEKPSINEKSDRIAREIGHRPIHLRVEEMVEKKRQKLEQIEEMRRQREEQAEAEFQLEYKLHAKKPEKVRSFDSYFEDQVKWEARKMQEREAKHQVRKEQEVEGLTFTPLINPKSKKLASSQPRLPITQNGLVRQPRRKAERLNTSQAEGEKVKKTVKEKWV